MKKILLLIVVIACTSFRTTSINYGLIAYFPMNENTVNVLDDKLSNRDFIGYGNPYTINASAYTNGSSSYYGVVDPVAIKKLTNKLSLSFGENGQLHLHHVFLAYLIQQQRWGFGMRRIQVQDNGKW